MERTIYELAALVAIWGSYLRVAAVMFGHLRTIQNRARFVTFRMGWVEIVNYAEPFLLGAVTYVLHASALHPLAVSLAEVAGTVAGAALVLLAWGLTLWSFFSWPSVFAGHGVLADHRLMSGGAYGMVRHPLYLGVFLIWVGLALAFSSAAVFLITVLYVIPSYFLYMRAEEAMMAESFGEEYDRYRCSVPMLIPRLRRRMPASEHAGAAAL